MYITEHIPSTASSTRSITSLSTSDVVPSSIDPGKNITFMSSIQIPQKFIQTSNVRPYISNQI